MPLYPHSTFENTSRLPLSFFEQTFLLTKTFSYKIVVITTYQLHRGDQYALEQHKRGKLIQMMLLTKFYSVKRGSLRLAPRREAIWGTFGTMHSGTRLGRFLNLENSLKNEMTLSRSPNGGHIGHVWKCALTHWFWEGAWFVRYARCGVLVRC